MIEIDSALAWFGLGEGATRDELKRAYVKRLKQTRPDEDPEGFQSLRDMYGWALAELDLAEHAQDAMPVAQAMPVPGPVETPPTAATKSLDIDAMRERLRELGKRNAGTDLSAWLASQETLWSLDSKLEAAVEVARFLGAEKPPFGPQAFDAMAVFFSEWDADVGKDPYGMLALRECLVIRWYLAPGNANACSQALADMKFAKLPRSALGYLRQLLRPFSWSQVLTMALMPGLPSRMRVLTQVLGLRRHPLPDVLDARQVAFWEAAGDRTRNSWPRAAVGLSRCVAYALLFALPLSLAEGERGRVLLISMGSYLLMFVMIWFGTSRVATQRTRGGGDGGALPIYGLAIGLLFATSMVKSCVAAM